MFILYYKPTCPFSRRVLAVTDRLHLEVELKDINEETVAEELSARGGKVQVPYLVDQEKGEEMYDSDAIVSHLQSNYGIKSDFSARPRLHISDTVCLSCEG